MRSDADLIAAFRLSRHLRSVKADIVHAQTARAHAIGLLALKMGSAAKLVVSRRLDFPIRRSLPNLWKYRSGAVTGYIAVAGVIRDILVDAGVPPDRVTVINSSIDLGRFTDVGDHRASVRAELGVPGGAPIVGNVAALAWHKGQKDLVAAMRQILSALPDAWLVIVGGGGERDTLERLAVDLGVNGRVVFTGNRRDVPRLLTAFDVFCMSSYLEGLCNSVLEAFAMSVPVVATRAGGLPEIVEHEITGLLARSHDPADLAAALTRMLTDRDLASRTAAAGLRLVRERFGVDHMVDRTCTLYERLVPCA